MFPRTAQISISNLSPLKPTGQLLVLTSDQPYDSNTLTDPLRVVPIASVVPVGSPTTLALPPYSLSPDCDCPVLRVGGTRADYCSLCHTCQQLGMHFFFPARSTLNFEVVETDGGARSIAFSTRVCVCGLIWSRYADAQSTESSTHAILPHTIAAGGRHNMVMHMANPIDGVGGWAGGWVMRQHVASTMRIACA